MDLRSASPFWLLRSGLLRTYPPSTADARCNIAIIGAGITGALAAHTLVREGHDVIVLDRRDATLGSTVASTGLLLCETDVELHDLERCVGAADAMRSWELGRDAVARIGCLAQQLCAGDFHPRDTLYIASRVADVPRLIREFETRRSLGSPHTSSPISSRGGANPTRGCSGWIGRWRRHRRATHASPLAQFHYTRVPLP